MCYICFWLVTYTRLLNNRNKNRNNNNGDNDDDDDNNKPGGYAAKDGIEVVATEWEKHSWRWCPKLCSMMVALAVRVDEMTNLWQQLFDQHGFIQT